MPWPWSHTSPVPAGTAACATIDSGSLGSASPNSTDGPSASTDTSAAARRLARRPTW